jgi:hypothetical protein
LRNGDRERQSGGRSTRKARGENAAVGQENVPGRRQVIALELDPTRPREGAPDGGRKRRTMRIAAAGLALAVSRPKSGVGIGSSKPKDARTRGRWSR